MLQVADTPIHGEEGQPSVLLCAVPTDYLQTAAFFSKVTDTFLSVSSRRIFFPQTLDCCFPQLLVVSSSGRPCNVINGLRLKGVRCIDSSTVEKVLVPDWSTVRGFQHLNLSADCAHVPLSGEHKRGSFL